MLPGEPLGQLGIAPLERFDDLQVIDDRARGAVVLGDRGLADGAHMDEQVLGRVRDQLRAAQADDHLVEGDVGIGVLADVFRGRGVLKLVEQMAQPTDLFVRRVQRRQPCRHALERRPHLDHLDDLALGLAHNENAAARHGADEALLLENRQRLADRGTAHAECLHQLALIEAQLLALTVDVGTGYGVLEQRVGLVAQAHRVQRRECQLSGGADGRLILAWRNKRAHSTPVQYLSTRRHRRRRRTQKRTHLDTF